MLGLVIILILQVNLISPLTQILLCLYCGLLPHPRDYQALAEQRSLYLPTEERGEGCGPQQVLRAPSTMAMQGPQGCYKNTPPPFSSGRKTWRFARSCLGSLISLRPGFGCKCLVSSDQNTQWLSWKLRQGREASQWRGIHEQCAPAESRRLHPLSETSWWDEHAGGFTHQVLSLLAEGSWGVHFPALSSTSTDRMFSESPECHWHPQDMPTLG